MRIFLCAIKDYLILRSATVRKPGRASRRTHGAHAAILEGLDRIHVVRWIASGDSIRPRSEEHTSELQSLMRISYAVFCLKKKRSISETHLYNQRSEALHS